LFDGAFCGLFVRTPTQEFRAVAKPAASEMIELYLGDKKAA
jgi:hypothetical protein